MAPTLPGCLLALLLCLVPTPGDCLLRRAGIPPGVTTQQACDQLEALETKFKTQLDHFEKAWVAISQKYVTRICEGLGCEPDAGQRMKYQVEWGQIERSYSKEKHHLLEMLMMIEAAMKSEPVRRCAWAVARLEEAALVKRGEEVLAGAKTDEAAASTAAPSGPTAEALDEPEDSMELHAPEEPLAEEPLPAEDFTNFGPETDVPAVETEPEPTVVAVALNDDASAVLTDIGQASFNSLFAACPVVIYRRNGAILSVYRRISPIPADFNAYSVFTYTWVDTNNVLGTDFQLYSSEADMASGVGAWTFCNYNDADVGFPRDCGKTGGVGNTWFSMPGDIHNARGITSGAGFELFNEGHCPV